MPARQDEQAPPTVIESQVQGICAREIERDDAGLVLRVCHQLNRRRPLGRSHDERLRLSRERQAARVPEDERGLRDPADHSGSALNGLSGRIEGRGSSESNRQSQKGDRATWRSGSGARRYRQLS